MFEMALISLRVRFSIATNRFIYFLRNLPILKRVLPSSLHGEYVLKNVFTVFGAIFIASVKCFKHLLVMGITIGTGFLQHLVILNGGIGGIFAAENPLAGVSAAGVVHYALLTWVIMAVLGCFTRSVIAEAQFTYKNDDIMINYLGANPSLYAKSNILIDQIAHILLYTPYFLIAFFIAGIPMWGVLTTLVLMVGFRLLAEALNLAMFKRFGKHFGKGAHANIAGVLVIAIAAILPLYIQDDNISALFANPIIGVFSAAIGYFSWRYISNYTLYRKLIVEKIRWMVDLMAKHTKNQQGGVMAAELAGAKKWSDKVSEKDLDSSKHSNKTGFAYLNAIFFDRHNTYFRNKLLIRCAFSLLPLVVVLGFAVHETIIGGEPLRYLLGAEAAHMSYLFSYAPIFFFIIYVASLGRVVTASVFSNCDIQMLHYSYYRTRDNIFASFKSRITMILRDNFILTTVMSFSTLLSIRLIFGYSDPLLFGVFFLVLTVIGVLFAFNDLFLYYVIQPYDEAGKGKSTIYTIINWVIYVIAWINLQTRFDFFTYSAVISVATVAYIGLGLVLLLTFAPKRFKLR